MGGQRPIGVSSGVHLSVGIPDRSSHWDGNTRILEGYHPPDYARANAYKAPSSVPSCHRLRSMAPSCRERCGIGNMASRCGAIAAALPASATLARREGTRGTCAFTNVPAVCFHYR
jgi:hypothetical protein